MDTKTFNIEVKTVSQPVAKISAIQVQNITKQLWFTYQNGVWNQNPIGDVNDEWYIAAAAQNTGGAGNIGITLHVDGQTIGANSAYAENGGYATLEKTIGALTATKSFTVKAIP